MTEILLSFHNESGRPAPTARTLAAAARAALDTELDEALIAEGLAREVVHRIQTARKQADLDYADRIQVRYAAGEELGEAIRAHANWIANELMRELKDTELKQLSFDGEAFGELVGLVESGEIAGRAGKDVLAEMLRSGDKPVDIVERLGLRPLRDEAQLTSLIASIVEANPKQVGKFRDGNERMLGFFIGKVMKETGGKADAKLADRLVREALSG